MDRPVSACTFAVSCRHVGTVRLLFGPLRGDAYLRIVKALAITDVGDRNEAAARILPLHILGGGSPEEILDIVIGLHQQTSRPVGVDRACGLHNASRPSDSGLT